MRVSRAVPRTGHTVLVHYCQSCETPVVMEPRGGQAVCPRCGRADDAALGPLFIVTR